MDLAEIADGLERDTKGIQYAQHEPHRAAIRNAVAALRKLDRQTTITSDTYWIHYQSPFDTVGTSCDHTDDLEKAHAHIASLQRKGYTIFRFYRDVRWRRSEDLDIPPAPPPEPIVMWIVSHHSFVVDETYRTEIEARNRVGCHHLIGAVITKVTKEIVPLE